MASVIEAVDVMKTYGAVRAVDGVSLRVEAGEILGIVGPNGAGKTTLVEIIEGLRPLDRGEVRVLGYDVRRQASAARQRIGIQLQSTAVYQRLTVRETLTLFASFYRRSLDVESVIALLHLDEKAAARVATLSGGQRQRLALAIALVNDPDVLFLDEPTTGLDPQVRCEIWEVIHELRGRGKTVLMTTHYMEEAERLCSRIVVMGAGRVIASGSPAELVRQHFGLTAVRVPTDGLPVEELRGIPSVASVVIGDGITTMYSRTVLETMTSLALIADRHQTPLHDIVVRPATLEDVVLKLAAR